MKWIRDRTVDPDCPMDLSQVQWQSAFDAIKDWVTIIDLDFQILWSNKASLPLLGLDPENILGKTCHELVHGTREPICDCPIPAMLRTGQRGETELSLPGGRWIYVTADPLRDALGNIAGAVHMVRDITARKLIEVALRENQERLSLAAEAASLGLWDWRMDLKRLFPNDQFLEMTGMAWEDTLNFTSQAWLERVHPEDRGGVDLAFQAHIAGEAEKAAIACRVRHPRKGWVWLSGMGQVIERNNKGDPIRMVGVHRDISSQVNAEKEREGLISKLEKALTEVKTLSGMLPICSTCKKIRDDSGHWSNIESYVQKHSHAEFSHSICPDCAKKYYPDIKIY